MKYEACDKLVRTLKSAFEELVQQRTQYNLERDLDEGENGEYFVGYDRDSVNNGIGEMIVRQEIIQDEDRAYEDAKDQVHEELLACEEEATLALFEKEEFVNALDDFLKGC